MTNQPSDIPTLETERLILRKLIGTDVVSIYQYACDPDVTRYLSWETHRSMEDTFAFLAKVLQTYDDGVPGNWGIEYKADQCVIGTIGFHHWRALHDAVEIGYVIGKPYWNMGLMTETVGAVLKYLFEEIQMNRVDALCCVNHFASERVMQKSGMKLEGVMRRSYFIQGAFRDMKMYSILRDEWLANRDRVV